MNISTFIQKISLSKLKTNHCDKDKAKIFTFISLDCRRIITTQLPWHLKSSLQINTPECIQQSKCTVVQNLFEWSKIEQILRKLSGVNSNFSWIWIVYFYLHPPTYPDTPSPLTPHLVSYMGISFTHSQTHQLHTTITTTLQSPTHTPDTQWLPWKTNLDYL